MKRARVDYSGFRLNKIREPEYNHLLYLFAWVGYFAFYFLTERFIAYDNCYIIHSPLDDIIPFSEVFVIFYVGWYLLIVGSLVYFLLYNPDNFKNLMKFIIVTQIVAMIIYIFFPNRQDLRPDIFPRDNFLTDIMGIIYSIDTPTNVCPSLHVAYSVGIASAFLKEKTVGALCKTLITIFCILVCISVMFVKQHSAVDVLAAIPVCILAEIIAFFGFWKSKKEKA